MIDTGAVEERQQPALASVEPGLDPLQRAPAAGAARTGANQHDSMVLYLVAQLSFPGETLAPEAGLIER